MPTRSTVVVLAADGGYAVPLRGTLRSVVTNQLQPERLDIVVLADDIPAPAQEAIAQAAAPASVRFIDLGVASLAGVQLGRGHHLTRAAAARLLIPELIDAPRVIYLDVDVLVRTDLSPLMNTPLDGRPLAAVRDPQHPWLGAHRPDLPLTELGADPLTPYFNSGVTVIDVDVWREEGIGTAALALLRRHAFTYVDQDALNLVVAGRWRELELRWNLIPEYVPDQLAGLMLLYEDADSVARACADPAIVHFAGPFKPWLHAGRQRDYVSEWRAAFAQVATEADHRWQRRETTRHYRRGAGRRLSLAVRVLRYGG